MAENQTRYIQTITTYYPQINLTNLRFNQTDGKHCDIVTVNDEVLFKFSRYDWTAAFLTNQIRVTDFIRGYVNMPLPRMEPLGTGAAKCEFVKGEPLYREDILLMSESDQNHIARQIGVFLRQLHTIPPKLLKENRILEIPYDLSRETVLSELEQIKRKVYPYCDSYEQKRIARVFRPVVENEDFLIHSPCLIHADLSPRCFLHDVKTKKMKGVVGFGCAGIGDPAYDFGVAIQTFGETFVKRIGKYYGSLTGLMDRARFYAGYNELLLKKNIADRIITRDFSGFRLDSFAADRMPVGSPV
ncbi:aminoglycoside phosphotransferase family protein [Caproiciproducens sp. LBM24188]